MIKTVSRQGRILTLCHGVDSESALKIHRLELVSTVRRPSRTRNAAAFLLWMAAQFPDPCWRI